MASKSMNTNLHHRTSDNQKVSLTSPPLYIPSVHHSKADRKESQPMVRRSSDSPSVRHPETPGANSNNGHSVNAFKDDFEPTTPGHNPGVDHIHADENQDDSEDVDPKEPGSGSSTGRAGATFKPTKPGHNPGVGHMSYVDQSDKIYPNPSNIGHSITTPGHSPGFGHILAGQDRDDSEDVDPKAPGSGSTTGRASAAFKPTKPGHSPGVGHMSYVDQSDKIYPNPSNIEHCITAPGHSPGFGHILAGQDQDDSEDDAKEPGFESKIGRDGAKHSNPQHPSHATALAICHRWIKVIRPIQRHPTLNILSQHQVTVLGLALFMQMKTKTTMKMLIQRHLVLAPVLDVLVQHSNPQNQVTALALAICHRWIKVIRPIQRHPTLNILSQHQVIVLGLALFMQMKTKTTMKMLIQRHLVLAPKDRDVPGAKHSNPQNQGHGHGVGHMSSVDQSDKTDPKASNFEHSVTTPGHSPGVSPIHADEDQDDNEDIDPKAPGSGSSSGRAGAAFKPTKPGHSPGVGHMSSVDQSDKTDPKASNFEHSITTPGHSPGVSPIHADEDQDDNEDVDPKAPGSGSSTGRAGAAFKPTKPGHSPGVGHMSSVDQSDKTDPKASNFEHSVTTPGHSPGVSPIHADEDQDDSEDVDPKAPGYGSSTGRAGAAFKPTKPGHSPGVGHMSSVDQSDKTDPNPSNIEHSISRVPNDFQPTLPGHSTVVGHVFEAQTKNS
ncbi:PRECURSOR OF CEP5 [Salix koriyanagi]|uniref:PRECURSOR OF CEP5 n=1 Tax=Salix koriyanagi TaxID=2511006 RepID=A0A9Q0UNB5_9ROSI|nr:PRECURSOR OF CEP5 [Salix koriyanagi]